MGGSLNKSRGGRGHPVRREGTSFYGWHGGGIHVVAHEFEGGRTTYDEVFPIPFLSLPWSRWRLGHLCEILVRVA